MSSDRHFPTPEQIEIAKNGVYLQLSTAQCVKDYQEKFNATLDQAIDGLGMRLFIDNQINVIATHNMWHIINNAHISKLTLDTMRYGQ